MSTYDQTQIKQALDKIEITQTSIEETSKLFLNPARANRSNIAQLVNDWLSFFKKIDDDQQKKLKMIFLLNHVLQNAKQEKLDEFLNLFEPHLQEVFDQIFSNCSDSISHNTLQVLKAWNERKVYPKQLIQNWAKGINQKKKSLPPNEQNKNQQQQKEQNEDVLPPNLCPIPKELIGFAQGIKDYQKFEEKTHQTIKKLTEIQQQGFNIEQDLEIQGHLEELKQNLQRKQKYRKISLQHSFDILSTVDKKHLKIVQELKKVLEKIDQIEQLQNQLNDYQHGESQEQMICE